MKKAIGYIRVSHELQKDGVSPEAQAERIKLYCLANGFELVQTFEDKGISGKRADNRPGLQGALEKVCQVKGVLVVYSLSRLARNVKETIEITERLRDCKADLASITEKIDTSSAIGQLFYTLIAALAQFESEQTGERIRGALSYLKRQGKKLGGRIPYGFNVGIDRKLVPVPQEQKAIEFMKASKKKGLSMAKIASELESQGYKAKNGGIWHPGSVYQVLERA